MRRPNADDALAVLVELAPVPVTPFDVALSLQDKGLSVSERRARRLLNILVVEGRATFPMHGHYAPWPADQDRNEHEQEQDQERVSRARA